MAGFAEVPSVPPRDPRQDTRYAAGMEEQVKGYAAELTTVEQQLVSVERLETVRSGMRAAQSTLEQVAGSEDALEKSAAFAASLEALIQSLGAEALLARQRELKQLIQQAKIDAQNRTQGIE